jgi:hypothetical protein
MKKTYQTLFVTALFATLSVSVSQAAIVFAGYHGTTNDASTASFTQLGNATSGDTILGYDLMLDVGNNPQHGIFASNTTSGNTRYTRFLNNLLGPQNEYYGIGGESSLLPLSGTRWNATTWSNVESADDDYLEYSAVNWPDGDPNAAPQNGFTTGLNWALIGDGNAARRYTRRCSRFQRPTCVCHRDCLERR